MAKLLLIDDDLALTDLLAEYLAVQGHDVRVAGDGEEGMRCFHEIKPDLVILDVSMPRQDGWQTLQRIRALATTPVVMITAHNEQTSVLRSLNLGADDYVSKPFSFAEMMARVQRKLSRMGNRSDSVQAEGTSTVLRYKDLVVDLVRKRVWRNHEEIHLTPTEFKILSMLMQRPGAVLMPHDVVRAVWGEQYLDDVGYVRRYIWYLRKKIEVDPSQPQYILNQRGFGYRFALASDEEAEPARDC